MLRNRQELELDERFHVLEAAHARPARGRQLRPVGADRYAEVVRQPFRKLGGYVQFISRRIVAVPEQRNRGERQFIGDTGILYGDRSGEETGADEAMGRRLSAPQDRSS